MPFFPKSRSQTITVIATASSKATWSSRYYSCGFSQHFQLEGQPSGAEDWAEQYAKPKFKIYYKKGSWDLT